ncbi:MAG TPA: hypothetical protein V6D06_12475 [Trichocoleus sp.]
MKDQIKSKRKRLNLELSEQAYRLLKQLADTSDRRMADVLRAGLALYGIAEEARSKGQKICVVEEGRVAQEIVMSP